MQPSINAPPTKDNLVAETKQKIKIKILVGLRIYIGIKILLQKEDDHKKSKTN